MHPAIWTFLAVVLLLAGVYEIWQAPRRRVGRLLSARTDPHDGETLSVEGLGHWLAHRLMQHIRPWLPGNQLEEARVRLLWAGQPLGLTAEEYWVYRIVVIVLLVALATGMSLGSAISPLVLMGIGATLGYMLPEWLLKYLIEERARQIRRDLPHFVHLLATALEAGMPMIEAVRRVAVDAPGLLAAEMMRTVQEMAAGKPAAAAWQHLSRRVNCQELQDIVSAIVQCQEFGVAIAEQLRFQMRSIRTKKQQTAKEKAEAAAVNMRIPVIVLIAFPMMVLLVYPALKTFTQVIGGK